MAWVASIPVDIALTYTCVPTLMGRVSLGVLLVIRGNCVFQVGDRKVPSTKVGHDVYYHYINIFYMFI